MSGYRTTATADAQARNIWRRTVRRWGVAHAERYFADMDAAVRAIAADPGLARPRPTLYPGLRARRFKAHIVYVLLQPEGLLLVAVLHRAMDARARLAGALRELRK